MKPIKSNGRIGRSRRGRKNTREFNINTHERTARKKTEIRSVY